MGGPRARHQRAGERPDRMPVELVDTWGDALRPASAVRTLRRAQARKRLHARLRAPLPCGWGVGKGYPGSAGFTPPSKTARPRARSGAVKTCFRQSSHGPPAPSALEPFPVLPGCFQGFSILEGYATGDRVSWRGR